MKRTFTLLILSILLVIVPSRANEASERFIEYYIGSAPAQPSQAGSQSSDNRYRSRVKLVLEEEYAIPREANAPKPAEHLSKALWKSLSKRFQEIQKYNPRKYFASLLGLLLFLLVSADLYLRFRISAALSRIPWEFLRGDQRLRRWPWANLIRKLRYWEYLKDLPVVEKLMQKDQHEAPQRTEHREGRSLVRRYNDYTIKVQDPGEARLVIAVLGVLRNPESAVPLLALIKKFPEDHEIEEDVSRALMNIRDLTVLPTLTPLLAQADPVLIKIMGDVFRSFGYGGVDILLQELQRQNSPSVRVSIFRVLGKLESKLVVPAIEGFLLQGSEKDRIEAARTLSSLGGEDVIQPMIESLCQNNSPAVRSFISKALSGLPRDRVVNQLTHIVEESPTFYFRIRAIEGLAALGSETCAIIEKALEDPHPKIRASAAAALERMGVVENALDQYLQGYDEELRRFLASVGNAGVIEPFISRLRTTESKALKRTVRLLARTGNHGVVPHLLELLDSTKDWTVKSRTIPALATLKASEAIPAIIEHLKSKHHWVRKTSIDALGQLLTPDSSVRQETLPVLHEALNEENPWTRASAVRVLNLLEDRACIPMLIELLQDPQTRVRVEAIRGLSSFYAVEAEADLIAIIDDPREKVCAVAAAALGKFRSRKALTKLFEKFDQARPKLRLAIMEAVYMIDPTELEPLVMHVRAANRTNLKLVRELKKVTSFNPSRQLMTLARVGETDIRCEAIRNLSVADDPEAEELLASMLQAPETEIRVAAVDALALSQDTNMSQHLRDLQDDPSTEVRLRVILALGLIKKPEALPCLRDALHDNNPLIRAHALLSLFHYAEPHFLEFFLDQFKNQEVQDILKNLVTEKNDPVVSLLVDGIPYSKEAEFQILKDHTLESLDFHLEDQILFGKTRTDKLRAIMIAEILQRTHLKKALKQALQEDPLSEVRARALRAYSSVSDITEEKELIQQAVQDPDLEVQTIASRLLIHFEEKQVP